MKTSADHSPKSKPNSIEPMAKTTMNDSTPIDAMGSKQPIGDSRRQMIQNSARQNAQRKHLQRHFGQPLQKQDNKTGMPDEVKTNMEKHFKTDFSEVRVHAGASSASDVGALAYTRGNDIHFAAGQFQPACAQGRQLLGHELTHVVQQRQGRVAPTGDVGGMPLNDDPALEKEADEMGKKV